jgi:hypothetical protein
MANIAPYRVPKQVGLSLHAPSLSVFDFFLAEEARDGSADYNSLMRLWNLRSRMAFLIDNLQYYLQVL